ncbi:MAG: D-2-hydroxyacid dehydrogenase [Oscillospiraceae bacterium]|nr:D-2-hydroxyacid dehydrogenase [Oscillospiraceae bacterium]
MNLLVTGAWQQAEQYLDELRRLGHSVCFLQQERDTLPCAYNWVEGVIANGLFLHHPIENFTNLRYIQLTSAGFDRVPMDYIRDHGITVHNARGVYSIPMAEFALSGVLQLYKQMNFFRCNQQQHRWEKHRGLAELYGKTVCIVGCGSVGTECAGRFDAFGCDVLGVDLCPRQDAAYRSIVGLEHLDEVLPRAHVVVLTLPLTEDTRHLFDAERLALMQQGSILVNIARGAVVDTRALISALENKLGGAVVDVFEEEPLEASSPLWAMDHVVLTPHNSFVSDGNADRLKTVIFTNLL